MHRPLTAAVVLVVAMAGSSVPASAAERSSSGSVNLALGMPATQSSSASYPVHAPAGFAVDGNTDGDLDHGSVAMTYRVTDAWWEVDLGSVGYIDEVVVWNRTDCCSKLLKRFHVFVSDVSFDVKDVKNTTAQDGVLDVFRERAVRESESIPIHRTGRYVRVQMDQLDAVLALAEVQVIGRPDSTAGSGDPRAAIATTVLVEGRSTASAPGPVVVSGKNAEARIRVTNTGGVSLRHLRVALPGVGKASCPVHHLGPGEEVECVIEIGGDPGAHLQAVQVAMSAGSGARVSTETALHYFVAVEKGPVAHLEFLVDGLNGDVPAGPRFGKGQTLTFSYVVASIGGEALTHVRVTDGGVGKIDCPGDTVEPGETLVCTRTWVAHLTETTNLATVTADRGVKDTERLYYHVRDYGREDDLSFVVTVNGADANVPMGPTLPVGSIAQLRYVLTNRSNNTNVWSAEILDPMVPADRLHCTGGPSLGVGQSMVCTATVTVTLGQWSDLVIARAWSSNGPRLDASDKAHLYGMP